MTEWKGCFPRVKQFFQRNIFYFSITLMLILRGGVMQVVLTNFSDVLGGRFYGLSLRLLYISPVSLFWSHASPWTSTIHGCPQARDLFWYLQKLYPCLLLDGNRLDCHLSCCIELGEDHAVHLLCNTL